MADEITREEQFLSAAAGNEVNLPEPITREEMYLAKAAGVNINITMLDPITRKERYLHALAESGGGGSIEVERLDVNENKTYTAEEGKAFSPVVVSVPNSYAAGDEGKVVSNGALVAQSSDTVTENGTVDTTLINSLLVNVSGGGGASNILTGTFTPTDGVNTISLAYSGTGYPILTIIVVDGGLYNSNVSAWYDQICKYAIGETIISKSNFSTSPSYARMSSDKAIIVPIFKNSDTNATSYANVFSKDVASAYNYSDPNASADSVAVFSSATTLKVYSKPSSDQTWYGFLSGVTYRYIVVYSS